MKKRTVQADMGDLKYFEIALPYIEADAKGVEPFYQTTKMMKVKVNPPKYDRVDKIVMTFSLTIPNHIHAYLLDKTAPATNRVNYYNRPVYEAKFYSKDFSKTINSEHFNALVEQYKEVFVDYINLKKMESAKIEKVLFYQFNATADNVKSTGNGAEYGFKSSLSFWYCVGFRDIHNNRFNSKKEQIHSHFDKDFYTLKFVMWTEERQVFFEAMQKGFATVVNNFTTFEENLNEETINKMMAQNQVFLLGK